MRAVVLESEDAMIAYLWFAAGIGFLALGVYTWITGDRRQALSDLLLVPLIFVLGLQRTAMMPEGYELVWGVSIGLAVAGLLLHLRRMLAERR